MHHQSSTAQINNTSSLEIQPSSKEKTFKLLNLPSQPGVSLPDGHSHSQHESKELRPEDQGGQQGPVSLTDLNEESPLTKTGQKDLTTPPAIKKEPAQAANKPIDSDSAKALLISPHAQLGGSNMSTYAPPSQNQDKEKVSRVKRLLEDQVDNQLQITGSLTNEPLASNARSPNGESASLISTLGKRNKHSDPGMAAYKRVKTLGAKLLGFTQKSLGPSIFEKSMQLPAYLTVQTKTRIAQTSSEANQGQKLLQPPIKKGLALGLKAKGAAGFTNPQAISCLSDFDFNLCSSQIDVQRTSLRCFEHCLDLAHLMYFGPPKLATQSQQQAQQGAGINTNTVTPVKKQLPLRLPNSGQAEEDDQMGGSQAADDSESHSEERNQIEGSVNYQKEALGAQTGLFKEQELFKFSQGDYLLNPLRQHHPFELWSALEMAQFNMCICRFDKNFQAFTHFIKTKTLAQIYDYYRSWKQTNQYRIWKSKSQERAKALAQQINNESSASISESST